MRAHAPSWKQKEAERAPRQRARETGGANDLQHAAAIFPPIRAAEIKSLDSAHTHTKFQRTKEKKTWQMVHQFTPPETPYLTLIGYDYIGECMSNTVLRRLPYF